MLSLLLLSFLLLFETGSLLIITVALLLESIAVVGCDIGSVSFCSDSVLAVVLSSSTDCLFVLPSPGGER